VASSPWQKPAAKSFWWLHRHQPPALIASVEMLAALEDLADLT
jgi:hypothetical protein